jgi:hypothetical protein
MRIVYAKQELPDASALSIFLAGPTPRATGKPALSWRPEAVRILRELGFKGHVFIPEDEDGVFKGNYYDQTEWEKSALKLASCIVFWVPRDLENMPAFTTNVEFGYWVARDAEKIVLGHPIDAPKTRYLDWLLRSEVELFDVVISETLEGTLSQAVRTAEWKRVWPPNA